MLINHSRTKAGNPYVQDWRKAAEYYETGAEAGNVEAQWCLGRMCQLGQGMEAPDEARALHWFEKAAEQNLAGAQYEVRCTDAYRLCMMMWHRDYMARASPDISAPCRRLGWPGKQQVI